MPSESSSIVSNATTNVSNHQEILLVLRKVKILLKQIVPDYQN